MPNDAAVKQAEALLESIKSWDGHSGGRMALIKKVNALKIQLEEPMDGLLGHIESMSVTAALNTLIHLGVVDAIPTSGSISAEQLSKDLNIEVSVIVRMMNLLTATGLFAEPAEDTYAHTPRSMIYMKGIPVDFFHSSMNVAPAFNKLPEYLKTHSTVEMADIRKTPYAFAYDYGKTYYEILAKDPEVMEKFNNAMMAAESRMPILGMFPFTSLKSEVEAEPERPFIVDIGGGRGHCLVAIKGDTEKEFNAEFILQDLPHVVDSVSTEEIPGIEKMAYDFNTPQPIKNAHIYYIRRILHNYQDLTGVEILKNTASAMGPKSRLLLPEMVVPKKLGMVEDVAPYWMDFSMMNIGGRERSAKDFARILDEAGLKLVKIWELGMGNQAVVEAMLK